MSHTESTIININIDNFEAAVATAKEPSLTKVPFVIAQEGPRAIVLSSSPNAHSEGIFPGMLLSTTLKREPKLKVVPPNPFENALANKMLIEIASNYSPSILPSHSGNLFLDVKGTKRLFGEPVDCALALKKRILSKLNMGCAVAVASNKLVAKIGSQTISPEGIAQIRSGQEASFLAEQDLKLLPGVGLATGRVLNVAGFTKIGEIAQLTDAEAFAILGQRGITLRNAALGLEPNPFLIERSKERTITRKINFFEPVLEFDSVLAAVVATAEDASVEMRSFNLATRALFLRLFWADGSLSEHKERFNSPLVNDNELRLACRQAVIKSFVKRIRLKGILLKFIDLEDSFREAELFDFAKATAQKQLQKNIDILRSRYGAAIVRSGATLYNGQSNCR
ncbi:MAG: DNA polymerase [Sphaerochaetaceae bacterium]